MYTIKFLAWTNKPDVELVSLSGADLQDANLRGADLQDADLRGANLRGAVLQDADLRGANLRGADLRDANLSGASLWRADLRSVDLRGADLSGADLRDADLRGAKNTELAIARTSIVPQQGAFVGWKKLANGTIAALLIPVSAARSNAAGRKCRAEFVEVLALYAPKSEDELPADCSAHAYYDIKIFYTKGATIRAHAWEPDRFIECAPGIHFFITREEAEAYCF